MVSEWKNLQVIDIANKVASGPFGSNLRGYEYIEKGVPVIRGNNLDGPRFNSSDYVFVSEAKADSLSSSLAYPSDVVFVARGSIGGVGIIPKGEYQRYVLSSNLMKISVNPTKADPLFVFYYFRSRFGQSEIQSYVNTTGVPKIERALESLRRFHILCPPLPEQRAIAHILGTLDDKIELNRRMNQTLEAMAQALFKSWFVDFEPFRDQGMQDSPLGEIPVGWEIGTLDDIAHNPRRSVQPNQIENDTAYIGLEHMPRHCITLAEWGKARDIQSNKFEFKQGEILFGKLRPYFHKVGIAPVDGVCSTDILVIVPKEQRWFGIVLCYVFSDEFVKYTDTTSSGTKMPRTNWDDMVRYKIVLPPEDVVEIFNRRIEPFVERIIMNILESRTLASIRDTLLPRLLSGEIRIKDAESFIAGKNRPG